MLPNGKKQIGDYFSSNSKFQPNCELLPSERKIKLASPRERMTKKLQKFKTINHPLKVPQEKKSQNNPQDQLTRQQSSKDSSKSLKNESESRQKKIELKDCCDGRITPRKPHYTKQLESRQHLNRKSENRFTSQEEIASASSQTFSQKPVTQFTDTGNSTESKRSSFALIEKNQQSSNINFDPLSNCPQNSSISAQKKKFKLICEVKSKKTEQKGENSETKLSSRRSNQTSDSTKNTLQTDLHSSGTLAAQQVKINSPLKVKKENRKTEELKIWSQKIDEKPCKRSQQTKLQTEAKKLQNRSDPTSAKIKPFQITPSSTTKQFTHQQSKEKEEQRLKRKRKSVRGIKQSHINIRTKNSPKYLNNEDQEDCLRIENSTENPNKHGDFDRVLIIDQSQNSKNPETQAQNVMKTQKEEKKNELKYEQVTYGESEGTKPHVTVQQSQQNISNNSLNLSINSTYKPQLLHNVSIRQSITHHNNNDSISNSYNNLNFTNNILELTTTSRESRLRGSIESSLSSIEKNKEQIDIGKFNKNITKMSRSASGKLEQLNPKDKSHLDHELEIMEPLERVKFHIEIINTLSNFVYRSTEMEDLLGDWDMMNFLIYKKFYIERTKVLHFLKKYPIKNPFCISCCNVDTKEVLHLHKNKKSEIKKLIHELESQNKFIKENLGTFYDQFQPSTHGEKINLFEYDNFSHWIFKEIWDEIHLLLYSQSNLLEKQNLQNRICKSLQIGFLISQISGNFVTPFEDGEYAVYNGDSQSKLQFSAKKDKVLHDSGSIKSGKPQPEKGKKAVTSGSSQKKPSAQQIYIGDNLKLFQRYVLLKSNAGNGNVAA